MLTERQEKLLNFVVREYLETTKPVASLALKKVSALDVSEATIRNDLQELTKQGYIKQLHTSGGRVPTQKAYKYICDRIEEEKEKQLQHFIVRQIEETHKEMERHMNMMQELMETLENDNFFDILNILEKWNKTNWNN